MLREIPTFHEMDLLKAMMLFSREPHLHCDVLFWWFLDMPSSKNYILHFHDLLEDVHEFAQDWSSILTEKMKTKYQELQDMYFKIKKQYESIKNMIQPKILQSYNHLGKDLIQS